MSPSYTSEGMLKMRSDWANRLGIARGWLLAGAVAVAALVYLIRR
jgi:hypothetical protein